MGFNGKEGVDRFEAEKDGELASQQLQLQVGVRVTVKSTGKKAKVFLSYTYPTSKSEKVMPVSTFITLLFVSVFATVLGESVVDHVKLFR